MKKVIFDTNFLLYLIKFKIDYNQELNRICDFNYKICILDKTLDELKKLKELEAKIALKYSEKFEIIKTIDNKKVDDILVDIASQETIIATQDQELKSRIRKKTKYIIIIRQKKYLKFE